MTPVQRALTKDPDLNLHLLPHFYEAAESVAALARDLRMPVRIVRRALTERGVTLRPEDAGPQASPRALIDYLRATRADRVRPGAEAARRAVDELAATGRLILPTRPKGPPPKPLRIPGLRLSEYVLEMRGR